MRKLYSLLAGFCLLLSLPTAVVAQQRNNDGFQRHNGQMHLLRNGQLRPMTRDARLPTGVVVTKDGFLVRADGQRTELREGQGCDLKGNVVAVVSAGTGELALAAPTTRSSSAQRSGQAFTAEDNVRAAWAELLASRRRRGHKEGDEKHAEKAWEKQQKEQEKWREADKKRDEKAREHAKKREEKRREGKEWDD